jgi:probable DNA repair protein
MLSFADTLKQLDTALGAGALALVPNYRSSDQLIDALSAWRRQQGAPSVQPRPSIVAIDLWLSDLWRALAQLDEAPVLASRLLSTGEEQLLWSKLIAEGSPDLLLLNPEGTATTAASGYRLLQQWQVSLDTLRAQLSFDDETLDDKARAFAWFKAFEAHCKKAQCLTLSGTVQALCALIAEGRLEPHGLLPGRILLWGFDQPPPLYRALFEALQQRGVVIEGITVPEHQPALHLTRCAQPDEEALAAAQWAAAVLRRHPEASIGLVTPDSDLLKGALARACARVFHATPDAFTNTLSAPLSDDAWVHAALTVLELDREQLPTPTVLALLRSPWLLAQDIEEDARAELELRLCQRQSETTQLAELRRLCAQEGKPWHCPQLSAAFATLQKERRQPRQLTLSGWLERFERIWQLLLPRELLLAAGRRALLGSWEQLLRTLYANDSHEPLNAAQALRSLRAHCRYTTLALGKRQAPTLLLTPVNATGMSFTHLWCLQMTDAFWPGEQRPHPYLPLTLQREHGMPAASPDAALLESRALFEGLLRHTSTEVMCSYAAVSEDLPQRPTTLLPANLIARDLPPVPAAALHPLVTEQLGRHLELVADATALPVRTVNNGGGANLIASQSACPFQAFARYRLNLREVPELEFGIPHHAIGSCVHEAMQVFWTRLQSSETLHALTEAELERQLREALRPALARVARDYPLLMSPALQTLEETRLAQLLLRWLDAEKQRAPFTLQSTELPLQLQLSGLKLDLRIDRVDRLADGSVAIVDYKTGRRLSRDWDSERPEAPQLLMYELAWSQQDQAAPSHALLYAQLNVEATGYAGIAGDDSLGLPLAMERFTSAAPNWNELRAYWQRVLTLLADEFLQGYAAVQPARRDSCTYCHYRALCRIDALPETEDAP